MYTAISLNVVPLYTENLHTMQSILTIIQKKKRTDSMLIQ